MSNPTSNFNWQMPTATDLVTDLPADFEVFGQAVDSSMADLLGGTTGQILAKNSNTNMDFVWITNDVGDITAVTAGTGISGGGTSGAVTITNSMATEITAKGDLIVGTGNATFDNLPAGTNGHVLMADSSVSPTGLKWAAANAFSGAFVTSNATQTITTAATYFALNFQAETYDTNGYHDNTTNNSRLTVPTAGYYRFQFATLATNAQFYRHGFFKNGTQVNTGYGVNGDQGTSGSGSIDLLLAANDYVEIMVYIAGASTGFYGTNSFAIPTYFSCQYLGA